MCKFYQLEKTDFEKEMIEIQYELLKVQKERNAILKEAFVIYYGHTPVLKKNAIKLKKLNHE